MTPDEDPRELFEHAPFGYLSSRADWTIVRANRTLLELLDLPQDEVVGRRLPELLGGADRIYHETHYAPLVELQGAVKEIAVDLIGAHGQRHPVLLSSVAVTDGAGATRSIRTGVVDMRDRRRYEQELLEARSRAEASERREQLLQRVLAELASAVTLADIATVLGSFVGDLLGASEGVLWLVSSDGTVLERHEAVSHGSPGELPLDRAGERVEALALREARVELVADGTMVVPLLVGSRAVGTFAARVPLGTALDDDRRLLLETLGRQAGQVIDRAQVYERKDQILGMVAHDLRTPLTTIGGFALTLKRIWDEVPDPAASLLIDRIIASSERLARLTDDLLDASALGVGRVQLDRSPRRIGPLIMESVEVHRRSAEYKGIELRAVDRTASARALIDADRVVQVIDNLVSNAVKFAPPNTTVDVLATAAADQVRVEVTDRGPGIPPSEQPLLFRAFGRTSSRPTGGETSTGLGLAITRGLVEAHEGSIEVTSEPGTGSTFTFRLPRLIG